MIRLVLFTMIFSLPIFAQSHEILMTAGYNYQNSDQGNGVRANLNGWFAAGQYGFNNTVSIAAEIDSYYGVIQGQSATQQNFIVGPQFTFRGDEAKLRPFLYF